MCEYSTHTHTCKCEGQAETTLKTETVIRKIMIFLNEGNA